MLAGFTIFACVFGLVLTNAQKLCMPDELPSVPQKGFCLSFNDLESCPRGDEISASKDCVDFDGAYCCYDPHESTKKSTAIETSIVQSETSQYHRNHKSNYSYTGSYSEGCPKIDDDAIIKEVNELYLPWIAGRTFFYHMPCEERREFFGYTPGPIAPLANSEIRIESASLLELPKVDPSKIPRFFDAGQHWKRCHSTIYHIRDQGQCGCCWAHASASVISDHVCLVGESFTGRSSYTASAEDLITCMPRDPQAPEFLFCKGREPALAMQMFVSDGVVSGGEFTQQNLGCMPYSPLQYGNPTKDQSGSNTEPICSRTCTNLKYTKNYTMDKVIGSTINTTVVVMGDKYNQSISYILNAAGERIPLKKADSIEHLIQDHLLNNGPVVASFTAYNDFQAYRKGIYAHGRNNSGEEGHAVKIVGWGEGRDIRRGRGSPIYPYWICINSWGTFATNNEHWGDDSGVFKLWRDRRNLIDFTNNIVGLSSPLINKNH